MIDNPGYLDHISGMLKKDFTDSYEITDHDRNLWPVIPEGITIDHRSFKRQLVRPRELDFDFDRYLGEVNVEELVRDLTHLLNENRDKFFLILVETNWEYDNREFRIVGYHLENDQEYQHRLTGAVNRAIGYKKARERRQSQKATDKLLRQNKAIEDRDDRWRLYEMLKAEFGEGSQ